MQGILSDKGCGVNFALLIITKLSNEKIKMAGFLFHNNLSSYKPADIEHTSVDKRDLMV